MKQADVWKSISKPKIEDNTDLWIKGTSFPLKSKREKYHEACDQHKKEVICVVKKEKDQKASMNLCSNRRLYTDNRLHRWAKAQTGKNTRGVL